MKRPKNHTLRAATRCEILSVAYDQALCGLGEQLVRAEAPKRNEFNLFGLKVLVTVSAVERPMVSESIGAEGKLVGRLP